MICVWISLRAIVGFLSLLRFTESKYDKAGKTSKCNSLFSVGVCFYVCSIAKLSWFLVCVGVDIQLVPVLQ